MIPTVYTKVTTMWPAWLKHDVCERVGVDGLTVFVIDAVQAHLDAIPHPRVDRPGASSRQAPAQSALITARLLSGRPHSGPRATNVEPTVTAPTVTVGDHDQTVSSDSSSRVDGSHLGVCPTCRSPLVAGDCWACCF